MRTVEHYSGGPDKLLRIETEGCAINVIVDLHDATGTQLIVVEVEARHPDQDAVQWEIESSNVVVVRRMGVQMMVGDSPYLRDDVIRLDAAARSGGATADA